MCWDPIKCAALFQASWGCLERCVRPCLDLMHSLSHSVGNSKSMKTRHISTVTIMHPTNSLHHCFTERLLCAGTVLSMEEREARSTLPIPGKIRAHVEWEHVTGNQRRVFWKALKEWHSSTQGNGFCLGTRTQSHKAISDHGLSLAAQWFITCHWTHSDCSGHLRGCQPSLPFSSWFPMSPPSLWRLVWREDTTLFKEVEGASSPPPLPAQAQPPGKASLRRWHLKDSNWIKNKKSSRAKKQQI